MRNKLFKALSVLLLSLTLISNGSFNVNTDYISDPGISVYGIGDDEEPFDDDGDNIPHKP